MSPLVKTLLSEIRQHPGFPDLLKAVERPQPARFKPNGPETPAQFNVRAIHADGRNLHHERWLTLLTGEPTTADD